MKIPLNEFKKGFKAFQKRENRDAMYKTASFLVSHFWGNTRDMADGMGVLLLTWNQAFYRYGSFDFDYLEEVIADYLEEFNTFRSRDILSFDDNDNKLIQAIFDDFIEALQICTGKLKGRRSPVAVAKALHLLCPNFFPLWDDKIARAYGCYYNDNPSQKYIFFSQKIKDIAENLNGKIVSKNRTILKLIDEYNYSKFTKSWI